jgi:hypothetical protein
MPRHLSAASCASSLVDRAKRNKSPGDFLRRRSGRMKSNPKSKSGSRVALDQVAWKKIWRASASRGKSRSLQPARVQAAFLICLIFAQRAFCAREILRRPAAERTRLARCGPPPVDPGPRVSFSRTEIASPSFWTWFCASRRSSRSRTIALAMFVIKYPLG